MISPQGFETVRTILSKYIIVFTEKPESKLPADIKPVQLHLNLKVRTCISFFWESSAAPTGTLVAQKEVIE